VYRLYHTFFASNTYCSGLIAKDDIKTACQACGNALAVMVTCYLLSLYINVSRQSIFSREYPISCVGCFNQHKVLINDMLLHKRSYEYVFNSNL